LSSLSKLRCPVKERKQFNYIQNNLEKYEIDHNPLKTVAVRRRLNLRELVRRLFKVEEASARLAECDAQVRTRGRAAE
jgi:hypothetical protein